MRTTSPSPPAGASAGSAGSLLAAAVGLLLGLVTLIGLVTCVLRQHRRGSRSARSAHAEEVPLGEGEQPWFETSIYVEDDDLSCDFTMRVEHAELGLTKDTASSACARILRARHARRERAESDHGMRGRSQGWA